MTDFLVSRATRDKLQEELKSLMTVNRPLVAKALEEARAHGDLKENAEYEAAKQEQSLLEARIRDLQDKLARARILEDENITGEHVSIGCRVIVKDLKTNQEEFYLIVGEEELEFRPEQDIHPHPHRAGHDGEESRGEGQNTHPGRRTGLRDPQDRGRH